MVRPATIQDAAEIARVHVATWRTAYRGVLPEDFLASMTEAEYEARWRRILEQRGAVFVAEADGEIVGFASGGRDRAGDAGYAGELYAIYVLEQAQGQGHGRALVAAVVEALRARGLGDMIVWVLRDNPKARRFYEQLGGVYVREQPLTIGSALVSEVSYGWRSLDDVRA